MNTRAFLGLSHSPLLGLNPLPPEAERQLQSALTATRAEVARYAPELVVLVAPDHYNGFFNELMPPFCIGTEATSVGDYKSIPGPLNVDATAALGLAAHLMDAGFDPALSRRMRVDHGFAQSLQLLWGSLDTPPVVPIFINAVAQPGIPRAVRCRALGEAIGRFLDNEPRRTLLIGSGGLSHEPPVPTMSNPDPAVRERITVRHEATPEQRAARMNMVMEAGRQMAAGTGQLKPINPAWDERWMNALAEGGRALDQLCELTEESIARDAGLSGNESKTWLVARSALPTDQALPCRLRHYQVIPEYIAGFGLMFLEQAR
jgi:2,3-dihydroxyphenylpropionate 1,2-dioxygenase